MVIKKITRNNKDRKKRIKWLNGRLRSGQNYTVKVFTYLIYSVLRFYKN